MTEHGNILKHVIFDISDKWERINEWLTQTFDSHSNVFHDDYDDDGIVTKCC